MEPCAASSSQLSRRRLLFQSAVTAGGFLLASTHTYADAENGVVRSAEAIHQEVSFNASAKRIYEVLTDAALFQKMELLSAAAESMDLKSHPAIIHREPGSPFSLFGDYIVGLQIELVPDRRIVQAWRVQSWAPGTYSIARYELVDHQGATQLIFDHTGFPAGTAEHLAGGWYANYWEPLAKVLGN